MQPDDGGTGLAIAAAFLFGRLALATAILWAYKHFAPSGFKPFALCLAGGFLVLYTIEVVRYAGLHKARRPA